MSEHQSDAVEKEADGAVTSSTKSQDDESPLGGAMNGDGPASAAGVEHTSGEEAEGSHDDRPVEAPSDVAEQAAEAADEPVNEGVEEEVGPDPALDDPAQLRSAVEAILFVVDAPLPVASIASALRQPAPAVEAAIAELRQSYLDRDAGIEVRDSAGGIRIYTRPEHAKHVERFLQDGQRTRLSQAALETLAVIAYRQPVTRSRVSAIRGVNVDGVVRTLLTRGLIVEVGNDPDSGAGLFRTSELFLERMGMQSLEELPSLAPLLPDLDGLETEEL